jgi:hypothetical protein
MLDIYATLLVSFLRPDRRIYGGEGGRQLDSLLLKSNLITGTVE